MLKLGCIESVLSDYKLWFFASERGVESLFCGVRVSVDEGEAIRVL